MSLTVSSSGGVGASECDGDGAAVRGVGDRVVQQDGDQLAHSGVVGVLGHVWRQLAGESDVLVVGSCGELARRVGCHSAESDVGHVQRAASGVEGGQVQQLLDQAV